MSNVKIGSLWIFPNSEIRRPMLFADAAHNEKGKIALPAEDFILVMSAPALDNDDRLSRLSVMHCSSGRICSMNAFWFVVPDAGGQNIA